ncbi:MAG: DNA polymerase/3'-5' exonuclease PolX [Luteolibacter sp.]
MTDRETLADTLDEIALLLELKGENPFKIRAYRQGAETVRGFDGDIVALAAAGELDGIKGIGAALSDKLHEMAVTGRLGFHEKLRAEFPETLFELFDLQGLGAKKIKALHDQLGVASVADLKSACEDGRVAGLAGFGEKSQEKILEAIAMRGRYADRFLLGAVAAIAEDMLETLRSHPDVSRAAIAGSYRRAKETLHDLDFLVSTRNPAAVCRDFSALPEVASVIACGETKASVRLANGLQCDLRAVSDNEFPFALQYFTGSKEHNVAVRSLALKRGLSLNEYGFTGEGASAITVNDEGDIYQALGLEFVPPELRENLGEIEVAASPRGLPRLIVLENLRGTFHNHTTASDGVDTLEAMAAAAMELGLQYLGIADHSKSSFQARGLDEARLDAQIAEIARLNAGWDDFRLFAGSEVDILKDGSLDFDDGMLARLDYVVASVHNAFTLDEKTMTRRICRAMENPHVTMLGHLTGRLLLKRDAYAVDIARVIDCAAETRTVIELNCSTMRLDMDWRWWHRARDKGVLCAINPDAHRTASLHNLGLGVRVARKGWLRREDVLNTRTRREIEEFLAGKQ